MSWPLALLGDHLNILSGFAFKSLSFNTAGEGLPLVRIRDVVSGSSETYYSGEYSEDYLLSDGDLLIGMDGDFNREKWAGGKALLNQRVCKVTAKPETLDQGYLYHFLPRALAKIHAETPAVTVKHLSVKGIKAIEIPLPPLKEQKRIAAILDKADNLRRKRQQAIQLADEFLRSVFLDMFGDPVTNPKGWDVKKFGQIGTLDRGKSKHRPRNDPALLGGRHPLIQTGDVSNSSGYITKYTSTYSDLGLSQSKKWPVGTLCITIAANIAKTGILTFEACFPDSVVGFTANELTTNEYIQQWLGFLQKTLEASAPESAQKNINLEILRGLDVPVPDIALQKKFSALVSILVANNEQKLHSDAEIKQLFGAISQKAFSGKL
ncbi:restriction endonuclease subunit S [Microbulbifer sp. TRSA002]|uniref:restriction endonuclease subunit S n=1 Tax=Microbulbifer sp. TRSA002 TaxID=3243382 RepID=UPI00403A532B